jgi:hypothetical protein
MGAVAGLKQTGAPIPVSSDRLTHKPESAIWKSMASAAGADSE